MPKLLTMTEAAEDLAAQMTGGDVSEIREKVILQIAKHLNRQNRIKGWTLQFNQSTKSLATMQGYEKPDQEIANIIFMISYEILNTSNRKELESKGVSFAGLKEEEQMALMKKHMQPKKYFRVKCIKNTYAGAVERD